jgi:hypothetical protein
MGKKLVRPHLNQQTGHGGSHHTSAIQATQEAGGGT